MKNVFFKAITMAALIFTFLGCSSDDSDIDLLNECPEGYMGANCDVKKTPSKIKVTKIVLKEFPHLKPDGSNWDSWLDSTGSEPDIIIVLWKNSQPIYVSDVSYDVSNNTDITLNIFPPLEIIEPNIQYTLGILDYDNGNVEDSEVMAGGNFLIYDSEDNGFPSIRNITSVEQLISIDFHLKYEFF
ncbi:hypothetical protein [Flavobacterium sp.]|uniref:hypothetical protein n=1 Tax=Flavobacterium sp. TaxID=239 RepID=UPI003A92278B